VLILNIEELKLVIELLKGVSADASNAAIVYFVLSFLQAPIIWAMVIGGLIKVVGKLSPSSVNVIKVQTLKDTR
jgi:hypothetical protein